jgi:hypothetical protein
MRPSHQSDHFCYCTCSALHSSRPLPSNLHLQYVFAVHIANPAGCRCRYGTVICCRLCCTVLQFSAKHCAVILQSACATHQYPCSPPHLNVLTSHVSCLPVRRCSLPVPYWLMCSAWVLDSFSIAAMMGCGEGQEGVGGHGRHWRLILEGKKHWTDCPRDICDGSW